MTDRTKATDKENPRITMGDAATALAGEIASVGNKPTAAHLDAAIMALRKENERFNSAPVVAPVEFPMDAIKQMFERELDQLFFETKAMVEAQHQESLNMFNGLRHTLNAYAADQSSDDVEDLIKMTNDWLDKTIKPISVSKDELARARENGRLNNENEGQVPSPVATEINLPTQEREPDHGLDIAHDIADGRER